MACQMADAVYETVAIDTVSAGHLFRANHQSLKFAGFTAVYEEGKDDEQEENGSPLPDLQEGESVRLVPPPVKQQHFTQPPPRYTEATLVRAMEEKGVGRPSTYASIVSTILDREYVMKIDRRLSPTPLGEVVTQLMKERFKDIIDVQFTAGMEEKLDEVGEGKLPWRQVLDEFYTDFHEDMEEAEKALEGVHLKVPDEETEEVCELCGRKMVIKMGRFGRFLACPGYPECKNTRPLVERMPGRCPKCGSGMLKRKSKRGYTYYACEKWQDCGFMTWDVPTADDCPYCGQSLYKKSGRGNQKTFCINPDCENFLPEDRAGLPPQASGRAARGRSRRDAPGGACRCGTGGGAEEDRRQICGGKEIHNGKKDHRRQKDRVHKEDHGEETGNPEDRRQKEIGGRGMRTVQVVGAGLAGCEAAWQLAQRGIPVELHEMRPEKSTPAHHTGEFAELVCSNSLRGAGLHNAVGLLKEELRQLDSLILSCADATHVEAGGALAVDRERFSRLVTERIHAHPRITVRGGEVTSIPEGPAIIATGPLTSDAMAGAIADFFDGQDYLSFYDAAAPLVAADSVDMEQAWFASRYDRGGADYVNCAMDQETYLAFVRELAAAEEAEVHGFEDSRVFEGCMPVEVMARRGVDTLRLRAAEAHGPAGPEDGAGALCRGAAAPRQRRRAASTIWWASRRICVSRSSAGCFA